MMIFSFPSITSAQAIRFQPQGAAAAGQGNAFAAQADDASAIHFNPAGLTQVEGVQSIVGSTLMGGSIKYKSPAGLDTRGDFGGSITSPPPSHFYLSANLGALGAATLSPVTLGLGLISLEHSLSAGWPLQDRRHLGDASPHRYQADRGL
jgi:long-chain fatty acid transport protein